MVSAKSKYRRPWSYRGGVMPNFRFTEF